MKRGLVLYPLTVAVFLLIDLVWLAVVARDVYASQLGGLMTDSIVWWAALLFYLLFCAGLLVFAILPALAARSLARASLLGAAFGFCCYMTYDLTNLATLRDWPPALTAMDIAWGTVLGGTVSSIVFWVGSRLHRLRGVLGS